MVVLAASICTRGGKVVVSRQFRDMPKSRVEALLSNFPRLLSSGTQHTTVETEHVRYVYQPLEELYMVLITNRQSNILQDISTLHLFAQVVTSTCRSCNEAEILRNAFELIMAFDEIKNFLEMDSHEEKIQEIIEKNKELEANEERKRRAKQLEQQRKEIQKRGGASTGASGYGPNGYSAVSSKPSYAETPAAISQPAFESKLTKAASAPKGKGMALGKKSKQADLFNAVRSEAEAVPLMAAPYVDVDEATSDTQPAVDMETVHIKITEHFSAKASRDRGVESMDIKGDLTLLISDRDAGRIKVLCDLDQNIPGMQMKTHPKVDKSTWTNSSTIALGDTTKSFPIDTSIGLVRWNSKQTPADFELPITVTCWPNVGNGTCEVTVEFEYSGTTELQNVTILIPLLHDQDPEIGESTVSDSDVTVNTSSSNLEWRLPIVSEDISSGSLEFTCAADDADEFFPILVDYHQNTTLCGLDVRDVVAAAEGSGGVSFSKEMVITGSITIG